MTSTLIMPTPAPSPLDNLHLSLGAALPRIRQRRSSSYHARSSATDPAYSAPRPEPPHTASTPILPHARSLTDPTLPLPLPYSIPYPHASFRPSPLRLHPLALAHMGRIAESTELLMRHLQATLAQRLRTRAAQTEGAPDPAAEGEEEGALQLDLGPARDELADIDLHLNRATLLKGLASFRANVDGLKRARHLAAAKRGGVHAVGPRRVFGAAAHGKPPGAGAGQWRPRRGAVVSLGGEVPERPGAGEDAWVEDLQDARDEEMDVEDLGERMGEIRLQD
ncbi:hypothetical protein CALVIDRAFT_114922 [Calocera viscosa TUFC12733]|uniref:Uncharacterized protein n=1 Tax=Calocera viscosa (strain TUFC12733) TaxID=1330018 RepID=A0A167M6H4_CALVF|nr:hypothetical protein CALVIDRAFT_114922 [Calocera viscosa TUFC12733]